MTEVKKNKKKEQLGMDPGTASHRLMRDTLWRLIVETENTCCSKCGQDMSRDTFSIEHIVPWLDSENPVQLFFDQKNIAFSHLKCNVAAARKPTKFWENAQVRDAALQRRWWHTLTKEEQQRIRREKYLKYGV